VPKHHGLKCVGGRRRVGFFLGSPYGPCGLICESAHAPCVDPPRRLEREPRLRGLTRAAFEGDLAGVIRLLRSGADPNDGSSLLVAAGRGWEAVTETLLAAGANANAIGPNGATPLWAAVYSRSPATLSRLLNAGADTEIPSTPGQLTPLLHATAAVFVDGVRVLLNRGANVEARSPSDDTALTLAIGVNSPELTAILIAHGADVEQTGQGDLTPLALAARRGYATAIEQLLTAGADPNRSAPGGWSPLAIAAFQGHARVMRRLLSAGADPNALDARGRTPLMWASWRAFPRCYRLLLSHGADAALRAPGTTTPGSAPEPRIVSRRARPLGISLLQRFGMGVLWLAARRSLLLGVPVGVCGLPSGERRRSLTAVEGALRLLEDHDPRAFVHVRQFLKRILIVSVPGPPAMLLPALHWCVLRWSPVGTDREVATRIAASLVHEATHARLMRLRFGYESFEQVRIERVCVKASLAYLQRLPDSMRSVRELELVLERLDPTMIAASSETRRAFRGPLPADVA